MGHLMAPVPESAVKDNSTMMVIIIWSHAPQRLSNFGDLSSCGVRPGGVCTHQLLQKLLHKGQDRSRRGNQQRGFSWKRLPQI